MSKIKKIVKFNTFLGWGDDKSYLYGFTSLINHSRKGQNIENINYDEINMCIASRDIEKGE